METLLTFLDAWVESLEYADRTGRDGEHAGLFPASLRDWGIDHHDAIQGALCDLEYVDQAMTELAE